MSNHGIAALTREQYWSDVWSEVEHNIRTTDLLCAGPLEQEFDRFFKQALTGRSGALLEVGCGSSRWLPYFARRFGFQVAGVDYSPVGCRQAETLLRDAGIAGEVLYRDALADNNDLTGRFDVVISLGFVEHFADTAELVRSLARYVKPGGLLISTSPNMAGILGAAQQVLNRPVYEGHVSFRLEELAEAHRIAGLVVGKAAHLGGLDFHMVNLHGVASRSKWLTHHLLMRLSRIGWKLPLSLPRNRWWSSALAVSAAKPV